MKLDVAVIVVTHNSAAMIDDLLDSLPNAMAGLAWRTVVVDNASTDETPRHVQKHSDVLLIHSENLGYSAGINRGVGAVRAPAYLILNPDVRMDPGSVPPLLAALSNTRDPRVGITAPRIRDESGVVQHSLRRDPTLLRALGLSRSKAARFSEYVQEPRAYAAAHGVDWALGAILAVSRECLDDVGAWDESYFLYSEETDFCLRARARGYLTWFVPSSTAVHVGGGSGQNDWTHTLQILNRVRFYARGHSQPASTAYYALTVLSEATWLARGHRQSRASLRALLKPSTRPPQVGPDHGLIPS